jgi:BlaI family transcriptional regulator, penicillinase repressor
MQMRKIDKDGELIELTKAEEQVMQVLWKLKKAFVKDILQELPPNKKGKKPDYNTVSTIITILRERGFVGFKAYGKTYEYFPLIEKSKYSNFFLQNFLGQYFGGSFEKMVSFFVKQNDVDLKELEDLMKKAEEMEKLKGE